MTNKKRQFKGYIYLLTDREEGDIEVYVGQSRQDKYMDEIHSAMRRCAKKVGIRPTEGKNRFDYKIICTRHYKTFENRKTGLNKLEVRYIDEYNTHSDRNLLGLNETSGGSSHTEISKKSRKKISVAGKKRYECQKVRKEQSKRMKKMYEDPKEREKISKKIYARKLYGKREKSFTSLKEAAEYFGVLPSSISKALRCELQLCKGYQFRYEGGEYREYIEKYRNEVFARKIGTKKRKVFRRKQRKR